MLLGCARGQEPAPAAPVGTIDAEAAEQEVTAANPADGATGPVGPTVPLTVGSSRVLVEVADTDAERSQGLMYRDGLASHHGMLFVYPDSAVRGFWMKNTRIPLDIAFIDQAGVVVHIATMQPLDLATTSSVHPAMYALEMAQGWFAGNGVDTGAVVQGLPGPSRE